MGLFGKSRKYPRRKVVDRQFKRDSFGEMNEIDLLECGHEVQIGEDQTGEPRFGKRRRCLSCYQEREAVAARAVG